MFSHALSCYKYIKVGMSKARGRGLAVHALNKDE